VQGHEGKVLWASWFVGGAEGDDADSAKGPQVGRFALDGEVFDALVTDAALMRTKQKRRHIDVGYLDKYGSAHSAQAHTHMPDAVFDSCAARHHPVWQEGIPLTYYVYLFCVQRGIDTGPGTTAGGRHAGAAARADACDQALRRAV
jgi:hypothetical protein